MKNTLMVSVAIAALLAATGLATAQGVSQGGATGSESPAAVSPKAETAAPMNAPASKGAATTTTHGSPAEGAPQHAQGAPEAKHVGEAKADSKSKASEATAPATSSKEVKNPVAETKPGSDGKAVGGMKADGTTKASRFDHYLEGPENSDG